MLANGGLKDVNASAVEKTRDDLKKAEANVAKAANTYNAARTRYADEMHKCSVSFTAMSDEKHDLFMQTLLNAKNAYQSAIKAVSDLRIKLKLDQGVINRLLSGIIANARAEVKENAQTSILSEAAARRMDAGTQKADGIKQAAALTRQPSPENVSNEGNAVNTLAQMDGSSIMKEGSHEEFWAADGVEGWVDGQASADTGFKLPPGVIISEEKLRDKPLYSPNIGKWLAGGGTITVENRAWIYTNRQGISVTYINGYPDFKVSGHVKQEIDIGSFNGRIADFRLADQLAPNGPRSLLSTWHHHEDGKTLQEVNRRTHEMFTHKGGVSIIKRSEK